MNVDSQEGRPRGSDGMVTARKKSFDLKEACVRAAREVIAEQGIEALSMRDVARKLGISHQAPYRHFESRDHLLAEIMRRCFVDFAEHLDRRKSPDVNGDPEDMGSAYLAYAAHKPLEYRLMFGTPWPEPARHPELVKYAVHAFDILRNSQRAKYGDRPEHYAKADLDALFIWSTLHGMASIMQANVMQYLVLAPEVMPRLKADLMGKIDAALEATSRPEPKPGPARRRPAKP
ncbi:TetR/AcrR family transcriptional regulator [Reyranella sp.]|uniref:TetR/AcrR family transcriptional regulator n=1 Tax=Reyranella sp. TaxID=1929291 RepID=UPI003F6EF691